ncbi:nSTAND1 domain-containing NTPase [Limnofasciculus baicalensis]|uniref:Tetratricopeptide repeat protein n=1 Tax=Limnofasciculus baicalensis BBK-W-15 TaxID=2699891 RepID=A0AAE3GS62_9CYAN|nr:tetratricopeptide repeat protein [Limnofasciculus baicalensis]MCP2728853.1 tetratricopeptide repeat protein [Limnofasciculus baicalensis BBK-W-15]
MVDQNELFDQLKKKNESQFEELLLRLKVDKSHIRWSGVTLSQKVVDLIGYLAQQEDGLQRLQERLELEKPDDMALILACPYQELFAFQEEDAKFFFGRSTFINDLVQAVKTKPLVAVVGASGSGKSSLVFAGLLPHLRQEGSWLIEYFRPEKQPFNRLAAAFVHQLEPELSKSDRIDKAINLADTIRQHGFAYVVSEIIQEHPGKQLLLVVDQFEELYTVCAEEERDRFIDVLLAGINDSLGLKVVLTLRADFCGQAYSSRPLADALQSADLKLGSMNGEELREAIERPAQLMEVELEEKLTEKLLEDVKQEPGNLPLLEFALTQLWKKQRQRTLTHQAYAEIGGVAKALANHAETVYAKLNETQQQQAQRIFLQLVHPGEGTEDTRRVATRGEMGGDNWELVTHLAGSSARLVVTGRNEETQEDTVEIVHEALLREWKQLRDWIKSDRSFRIWQEELRSRRRRWQRNEQNEEDLLTGSLLSAAEVWLDERQADLSPEDGEFIRLSVEVRDRKTLEKLSIQIELETERKQKEAAEQSNQILVKAQRKAKQIVRFGFATMSFSMMLGILFIVVLPWSAIFFNNRGLEKLQAHQIKDALSYFNLALIIKPGYPTALYTRGLVYEDLEDFDLAMANYEAAVKGHFPPAYNNLAYLKIKRGDYALAARLLEEGLGLETDLGTKYTLFKNLGWAQLYLNQYNKAEANLRQAITLDGQRGSAYCLLAQVLEKESNIEAEIQWQSCLKFSDPHHPDESEWRKVAQSKLKK